MRCKNCGAAMKLIRGRDYFVCEFCQAFHFPQEESQDGVRVMGELHAAKCPLCREQLVEASIYENRVLHCSKCRGVLVHRPAFTMILKRFRTNDPPDGRRLDRNELERTIACPRCRDEMETHPYLGPSQVVIDTCSKCALIWLDHGELYSIVTHDAEARVRRTARITAMSQATGNKED